MIMDTCSDAALVNACLSGNRQAWVTLVERYQGLIFSIPLRYGMRESQAADVFQDVCVILFEKLDQLQDETRVAAWIGTTTRRHCWKLMSRRDATQAEDALPMLMARPAPDANPADIVAEWEAWHAVREAVGAVPEPYRTILKRLYYTAPTPSYAEIAEALDLAVGSIGPMRARALQHLRRAMHGWRGPDG